MPALRSHFIENLFRNAEADLRSYVRARLDKSARSDVDDIVQESFLRVSTSQPKKSLRNPRGFLFRTAKNLMIDEARKDAVRNKVFRADPHIEKSAVETAIQHITPEREISSAEELNRILEAIDQLPEACQRVFLLQRKTGMSYAKVAAELNISESMVQKHMSRALCELYELLP